MWLASAQSLRIVRRKVNGYKKTMKTDYLLCVLQDNNSFTNHDNLLNELGRGPYRLFKHTIPDIMTSSFLHSSPSFPLAPSKLMWKKGGSHYNIIIVMVFNLTNDLEYTNWLPSWKLSCLFTKHDSRTNIVLSRKWKAVYLQ